MYFNKKGLILKQLKTLQKFNFRGKTTTARFIH